MCDQMQTLHLQSVAFLLCMFTTHPPPPSSLFYSTEINSHLPETGFRCCLLSTVIHCIKGDTMPKFLLIWGVSSGSKSISSQKSHENIGNPHYIQRQHNFFCSLVSMKHCMASLPCLNPTTWSIMVSHNF